MSYLRTGLVVSALGGVALKLIFADSLNTGLKDDVISIVLLLVVSCAKTPPLTRSNAAYKKIR
jgi:hypothetical protein